MSTSTAAHLSTHRHLGTVVRYWDVYRQQWESVDVGGYLPSDRVLATLSDADRELLRTHLRPRA